MKQQPRDTKMIRAIGMIGVAILVATAIGVVPSGSASAAVIVSNNTSTKVVTITSSRYALTYDYNLKSQVTSLLVDGTETLESGQGVVSAANESGTWITTSSLAASPTVTISGSTVTATLSTSLGSETWVFTGNTDSVTMQMSRTYSAGHTLTVGSVPLVTLKHGSFEGLRWPGDGGVTPVGGSQFDAKQGWWLGPLNNAGSNNHTAKEQLSMTAINRTTPLALQITGSSNHPSVSQGNGTDVWRDAGTAGLRLAFWTSASALSYPSTTSSLGYSTGGCTGHMTCGGAPVFGTRTVVSGQTDQVTLDFAPKDLTDYYDLGTLKGIDKTAISRAINDYGRWMMQDTKIGATTGSPGRDTEAVSLDSTWIAQMLELFPEQNAIDSFKSQLGHMKDYLQAVTGELSCCRPQTTVIWGPNWRDKAPGYALGVSRAYDLSGDTSWLGTMRTSVEGSLDWELSHYYDSTAGMLTTEAGTPGSNTVVTGSLNNYWESSAGSYDGYSTAMLYDALTRWAVLEQNVLSNPTKSASYAAIASNIKTKMNLAVGGGGLWSTTSNTFLYGSGNQDVRYLPMQGAVLKSDLASPTRMTAIAASVESAQYQFNADVHYMNYWDNFSQDISGNPVRSTDNCLGGSGGGNSNKSGENGGWYGTVDGDFYAGFPRLADPTKIPTYIGNFANRYYADGFYGWGSAYQKGDNTLGCASQEWWPTQIMPVWGLYHYGYGFQPAWDGLRIAPFIDSTMVGSVINYRWRNNPLTLTLNTQTSFTVAAAALATPLRMTWVNQAPGSTRHITTDGGTALAATVSAAGDVVLSTSSPGTHTYVCTDCTVNSPVVAGTSGVTAWSPGSSALRNDSTVQVGMKVTIGARPLAITQLGRYFNSGNSKVHTLKIVNAAGELLGTATVDCASTTVAGDGFQYGTLATPVTLQPSTVYYFYSTELAGADLWRNEATSLTSSSDLTINGAAYVTRSTSSVTGLATDTNNFVPGGSYGPLNLKYLISQVQMVTSGTPRNDATVFAGQSITVGALPIAVNAIGRTLLADSSGTHTLKIVLASTGADLTGTTVILDLASASKAGNGFSYAKLSSPVSLAANTTYYVVSQETNGGDKWLDGDSTVQSSSDVTVNGCVYSAGGSWTLSYSATHSCGATNVLYSR